MSKGNQGADPQLRKAIRAKILALHKENKPIDRPAIKAQYTKQKPKLAQYIGAIVDGYTNHLKTVKKGAAKNAAKNAAMAKPSTEEFNLTAWKASFQDSSAFQFGTTTLPLRQATRVQPRSTDSVSEEYNEYTEDSSSEDVSDDDSDNALEDDAEDDSNSTATTDIVEGAFQQSDNALLQDFKEDLAGGNDKAKPTGTQSMTPSLEIQKQFLASDDEDDETTTGARPKSLEHSALVSAALEKDGYSMPSQFALLGKLRPDSESASVSLDPRVALNTNVPFSAFICGLQGSGKSHTTSCIIENCSMQMPALGNVKQSVSTLVLHYNEYSSNVNSQPSEAAFLASVLPKYTSQQKPLPLRVLVSPTNYRNLSKMYSNIPNVKVLPFKIQPRHLNISMMLSLMSMSQSDTMPLYMAQVIRVLRGMAMESGGHFDYKDFRRRLEDLRLDRAQTPFLHQRLDLLDSYLDLESRTTGDYFIDGGVTILDLSCPFVDRSTACILFRIVIDLFLYAHPSRGKMIVADEAHKYMTDTPAAKELTETFLTIIRQQRHLGVRTIISTQEPTISPRLIDLCSITIIHRFTSPQWYSAIRMHLPIERGSRDNDSSIPDGLYQIASLRTGEALVFAPSAHLLDGDGGEIDTKHNTFRLRVRKRVTWDGGRTIVAVR
ncbi:hypothetical protein BJX99DRAFT_218823 [Aspergillus californicus]